MRQSSRTAAAPYSTMPVRLSSHGSRCRSIPSTPTLLPYNAALAVAAFFCPSGDSSRQKSIVSALRNWTGTKVRARKRIFFKPITWVRYPLSAVPRAYKAINPKIAARYCPILPPLVNAATAAVGSSVATTGSASFTACR